MRNRFTSLCLLLLIVPLTGALAQDSITSIIFAENSFAELLTQAQEEDKLIFIDAYTTWCGPCKLMAKKVFTQARVAAIYNERFINAKFDMERGEGPGLANRYSVVAYPTYLFVNGDGELVHKGLGYIPADNFLELADVAVSDESMGAMNERYAAGDRDPAFVGSYLKLLNDSYEEERANTVLGKYLDSQEDWSKPEIVEMIVASPGQVGDKRAIYLVEHAAAAEKVVGSARFMGALQQTFVNGYMIENGKRGMVLPDDLTDYYAKHAPSLKGRLLDHYRLYFYERLGNMEEYLPAAMAYYTTYPSDDFAELNSLAWTFFENAEEEAQLEQALAWARRSVELNSYYPNLDTLAWLYHKLGQQKQAEATAQKAIEAAKEAGLDYSDTEAIFD